MISAEKGTICSIQIAKRPFKTTLRLSENAPMHNICIR